MRKTLTEMGISVAVIGIALTFALSAGAQTATTTTSGGNHHKLNFQCVATAVGTRETAIDTAWSTYSSGISTALQNRNTALVAAWNSNTDWQSIHAATKAAWQTYSDVAQSARGTWKSARESAEQQYKTDVQSCRQ